jgi:peptidoglycan hydrolase CwlO-like protein
MEIENYVKNEIDSIKNKIFKKHPNDKIDMADLNQILEKIEDSSNKFISRISSLLSTIEDLKNDIDSLRVDNKSFIKGLENYENKLNAIKFIINSGGK